MANNKKFIVKNGLQTSENVVIGSATDNGVNRLQVTGSTKLSGFAEITQPTANIPSINITNSGGYNANSIIGQFTGDTDSLKIINFESGAYTITNGGQDNGVRFYNDTNGLEIVYNNSVDMEFSSTGIDFKREPSYNGSVFWNAGNDGANSGLDADLLDGLDSLQFLRSDQDDVMYGSLVINGDLTVTGNTTTVNTEEILLADNIITLNSNYTGSSPTENAGIEVERGTLNNAIFNWNETSDRWQIGGVSQGLTIGDASSLVGDLQSYANSFIIQAGGAAGVSNGTAALSGKLGGTDAEAGVASYWSAAGVSYGELRYNGSPKLRTENTGIVTNGNARIQGSATIGTGSGGAYIYMDGAGNNGTIYSSAGEIGFLNNTFNYAFKVDAAGDAIVTDDIYAQRWIDINDNTYLMDLDGTSVANTLGLDAGGLFFNNETNTKIAFATGTVNVDIAGTNRLSVTNTHVATNVDMRAPRFVDSDDNNYYVDPASISELNSANFYSGSSNNSISVGNSAAERLNFEVTGGQAYIRYYQDETNATDHSVNFEIVSSGSGLNRFNFNKNIYATGQSMVADYGLFSGGVYGSVFYDYDDETYYADFNNTDVSIKAAGEILAGNGSSTTPSFSFVSDPNTGMFRGTTDRLDFAAGGNVELRVTTTYVEALGSFRAPAFYDSQNTSYYGDFASTSVMNAIGIDSEIFHNGDTDTKMAFATDAIQFNTAGVTRLTINTTALTSTLNTYAPRFYTDDYMVHTGDTNTYIGFNAADTFGVWTNGGNRLSITNSAITGSVDFVGPRFLDSDNNAYLLDPSGSSVLNSVGIDADLFHNGDTDTKINFTTDTVKIDTAGTTRLTANNTGIYVGDLYATNSVNGATLNASTSANAPIYYDSDDNNYYADFANATTSILTKGAVAVGTTIPTAILTVNKATALGANPFAAGQSYISMGDQDVADFSIRGDSSRNAWVVAEGNGQFIFTDSGATPVLTVDNASIDVIIGDQNATYATSDAGTTFIASPDANQLHVNGSLQLNGKNNVLSIGAADGSNTAINEATFLATNELGFGAGGGFYMDETTTIKIRNNKALYSTGTITGGNIYAPRYYDSDNNAYYGDFASTSVMNRIDIDDYIRHNGDTNTYLGFSANDTIILATAGATQMTANATAVTAATAFDAPIFRDSSDSSYSLNGNTSNAWRVSTPSGYVDIGPQNTSYAHFSTDRANFYFNKGVEVDTGIVSSYNENLDLRRQQSTTARMLITSGLTYSYQDFIVSNGTVTTAPARLIIQTENQTDTNPGDMYAQLQFKVAGTPGGLSASGLPGTDGNTIAMITAEDFRSGSTSNEDSGIGFYTSPSGNALQFMGGISSTGAWYAGNLRGTGTRGEIYAEAAMYATRFYDRNNVSYYVDPAATSIMNTVRAGRYEVDSSSYYIDGVIGGYGTIRVSGNTNGWAGYAINDDWVFMSSGAAQAGIYNDTNDEWALLANQNGSTELYSNGVHQISAQNGYGYAPNSMRAPVYYNPSNTTYFLDLDNGNTSDALRIGARINRSNFNTSGNGTDNALLVSQDANHWIWQTASNWGMFWATNSSSAYRDSRFGDNTISFVGNNNLRALIDLDTGDFLSNGEIYAGNYNLTAGNESIPLNPAYGAGITELKLFDGNLYWEKRAIQALRGNENGPTTTTGEYVKSTDAPGSSSYILRSSGYRDFYSDMIEVEPGEEIYGEMWVKYVSGSGGLFYYGVEQYDKDKNPIATNQGTSYFVAGGSNVTSTSWQKFSGHLTLATSHTPYNGSDGGAVRYVRIRVLMNYNAGGAVREFTAPILMRTTIQGRIRTDQNVYASIYYDSNDNNFYVDPNSVSNLNDVRGSIFRDRDNTAYYMNPASGGKLAGSWDWTNGSIENLNNLSFNDPGPQEGIRWKGGNEWKIYESPDNLSTNSGGNLQITSGSGNGTMRMRVDINGDVWANRYMRAQRFYDTNDANYYADPAGSSIFANLYLRAGGLKMERNYNENAIWWNAGTDQNHVLWNHYYGGPTTRGAAGSGGFDGMKWNTYQGLHIQGGLSGAYTLARFATDGAGSGNTHYVRLYANNTEQLGTRAGYGYAPNQMRSPIYYDSNDTAYYGDFASTSLMNTVRVNRLEIESANYYIDVAAGNYGTIRVEGVSGSSGTWAGYAIRDDWVFMSNGANEAGIYNDTDNEWAILAARNSDVQIYYNGTWEERSRSGYMEARGSYRSPVWYDSNNTTYRIDGNGTSRLLTLQVDNVIQGSVNGYSERLYRRDNRIIAPNEDPSGFLRFGFTSWDNNNTSPWADYLHLRSYTDASGGSDNLVSFKKSGIGMRIWQQSWNSGTAYSTYRNVAVYNENPDGSSNDLYAARFYDEDNTSYYMDPASTSQVNTIQFNGGGVAQFATSSGNIRGYMQATETNDAHLIIATSGGEDISFRDGGLGGQWNMIIRGNGDVLTLGTHYAQRFTDRNDTGYYADPASTSVMSVLDVRSEVYNDGWFRNDTSGRGLYNTATTMHWYSTGSGVWRAESTANTVEIQMATSGNATRGYVYANNSNDIGFLRENGNWIFRTRQSYAELYGDLYANIFYDRNNSGYYVDPASTSNIYRLQVAGGGGLIFAGSVSNNDNRGIFFDGARGGDDQPYAIYRENGGWSNPYPDLRIAFHTGIKFGANAGYQGMRFYTDYNMSGQVMSINNGSDPLGGGNVYVNNNLQAGSSLRAPIFYDSNDTNYRMDMNATNSSRFRGVQSETMAYMGLSGQTRSSKEYYAARPRITGDTNYWTGNMGWGTIDMNTIGNWGAGFIDSWSNPGNQPSGTSHWVGVQSFHYTNGSSRYGWQMVGGPIENLRFRSSWGGFRTWRTIPVLNVNDNNNGAMYANIYYDTDNTGFYCDPSSFSNFNTGLRGTEIYARNWFRNDNSYEGIYNQATGFHAYSYTTGYYVLASNNNGHAISLQFRGAHNGTLKGWVYGDGSWHGFLNSAGSWKIRTIFSDGYSPSIRFEENGDESWTGDPGNDVGKIEYHSNRFYIVAGGNSNRIVQFRRNGSDRSYVDNNGLYVGTATSARWADLAERYAADDIYETGTLMGIDLDGDAEITIWREGLPMVGVISTNPAVQMNDMGIEPGSNSKEAKMNPFIALKGRIPCKVSGEDGSVKKGMWLIPDPNEVGKAMGVLYGTPGINTFDIIGIALCDSENGEVEVKV